MKASEDFKCYMGLHHMEIMETFDVKDNEGHIVAKYYISRCRNCGKMNTDIVLIEQQ